MNIFWGTKILWLFFGVNADFLCNISGLSILMHGVNALPEATSYDMISTKIS